MRDKKQKIFILNDIIQNKNFNLNSLEFYAYSRLAWAHYRNYKNNPIEIDHKKLMLNIGITDTRTLKKIFRSLYVNGLIENEVVTLPKRNPLQVTIVESPSDNKNFTMLPVNIFNWMDRINHSEFRLLFYYQSYINKKRNFCFAGFETICTDLKIGRDTLISANEHLKKLKLITIEKHKLENTYEYDENDEMVFSKYNNHYKVQIQNM